MTRDSSARYGSARSTEGGPDGDTWLKHQAIA
jgi:hypothetical protein